MGTLDDDYTPLGAAVHEGRANIVRVLLMQGQRGPGLPATQVAHVLTTAVPGLKESARSADDLRERIKDLLGLVISSLQTRSR